MGDEIESLRPALQGIGSRLAIELSEPQADSLIAYLALLHRWNATYNLTAIREPAQMLTHHLADCLAVVASLRRQVGARPLRLLDVGSGAGLPGLVIAILCPQVDVTCVDAVGKKAAFVQQAAGELGLQNLHAEHSRVEGLTSAPFNIVASRAFASLANFIRLTEQHLAENGVWMAMKGKSPASEIALMPAQVELFHVEQLVVPDLDAERCIVWIRRRF